MSGVALAEAITALLPDAIITRQREHDWHSATFSGRRVVLDLKSAASAGQVAVFAAMLEDHEFSIPDTLVADIALTAQKGGVLTVEALLLDEEV
jgi:hypothetical protein